MHDFNHVMFEFGQFLRLVTIMLSFLAMYCLWDARRKRRFLWTPKLYNIWLVQIGWTFAAAEANIELWYRHSQPSVAIGLVIFLLCWSIKASRDPGKYTIDQPDEE